MNWKARVYLQDRQVLDQLVGNSEGHLEDHLDKVPVLRVPEKLRSWRLTVEFGD